MALRDILASIFGQSPQGYPQYIYDGPTISEVLSYSAGDLYRTQPHLRTVVSFLSRSVAQLGLQVFERVSDTDRRRISDDPIVALLTSPNPSQTQYELFDALISELCLYDNAYWFIGQSQKTASGWVLQPIPSIWLQSVKKSTVFDVDSYSFLINGQIQEIPAENIIHFHGWNPVSTTMGLSPVEALKQVLAEQMQAWSFREQLWKRGGRVGMYLHRPVDAPEWSREGREKFNRMWSEFSNSGSRAGSTPLLEDGIELRKVGYSSKEDQWLEAAKLSLATVASVYQVNPVMVGILDNANFSNTQAFRKMLYSDTLGPILKMVEDRVNSFLIPKVSRVPGAYGEFNIQAKLAGDFEEQAAVLSSSVGAPWMTRNEARALQNLPGVEGGDELITPLNVIEGGLASPRDTDTSSSGKEVGSQTVQVKAVEVSGQQKKLEGVLQDFFDHQSRSVLSKIGSSKKSGSLTKEDSWWDEERWNSALSKLLRDHGLDISTNAAAASLLAAGIDPSLYDQDRTEAYIASLSDIKSSAINSATKSRLDRSLGEDSSMSPESVFEYSKGTRSALIAGVLHTSFSGFGKVESGRQVGGKKATKTWIHNAGSKNPRDEHSRISGETVLLDDSFSNGAKWPGDDPEGAAGNAYCNCSVSINYNF